MFFWSASKYTHHKNQMPFGNFYARLLLFLCVLQQFNVISSQLPGVWTTDTWGQCEGGCGVGGAQMRGVSCRHSRSGYHMTKDNCDKKLKPLDRRECFKICEEHRAQYEWKTAKWGECLIAATPIKSVQCGSNVGQHGVQTRDITCISLNSTSRVPDYVCEYFNILPPFQQNCSLPCPQNCVTSQFGEWTLCSKTCGNGTQTRSRNVLRKSKYGGQKCPSLLEIRACTDLKLCPLHFQTSNDKFKFQDWSICKRRKVNTRALTRGGRSNKKRRRPRVNEELVGARNRRVRCLAEGGDAFGESFRIYETCALTQSCQVSMWSQWSSCSTSCGQNGTQSRTRDITKLPLGNQAQPCPSLIDARPCVVDFNQQNLCLSHRWVTGGWSGCELAYNVSCGGGLQWRHVYCVQHDDFMREEASTKFSPDGLDNGNAWPQMTPVEDKHCQQFQKPAGWKECDIACRQKCLIGQWSDWSDCAFDHCPKDPSIALVLSSESRRNMRKGRGFKRRKRVIYNDNGKPEDCPHTLEVIPCDKARCFSWQVTNTSQCVPTRGYCGTGITTRTLECRDMWRAPVGDRWCRRAPVAFPVATETACDVPCGGDCVLGGWGGWTPCAHTCKRGKRESVSQTRKREILAHPSKTGIPCPRAEDLVERKLCNQHKCSIHYWDSGKWGECTQTGTNSPTGLSNRAMSDEGVSVEGNPVVYPQSEVCGVGVQTRAIHCRKKHSGRLRQKMCMEWDKPIDSRPCNIECRKDCVLSLWSVWSSCSQECEKVSTNTTAAPVSIEARKPAGLVTVHQRRSRHVIQHRGGRGVPCLRELEQTKMCEQAEECSVYKWHISKWSPCVLATGMSSIDEKNRKCKGVKTRTVQCYRHMSSGIIPADGSNCILSGSKIPHATRPCLATCPQNFRFGEWQEKNGCTASTSDVSTIAITESSLATTAGEKNDATYVPTQSIARPVGPWSPCIIAVEKPPGSEDADYTSELPDPEASPRCGVGRRRRAVGCFEEGSGVMLEISYCSVEALQEEICEVPCPLDCEMSQWTNWGQCGDPKEGRIDPGTNQEPRVFPCGENLRVRNKYFLEMPQNGGRKCPVLDALGQTYQTQPCYNECDSNFWFAKSFDTCQITKQSLLPTCGQGIQTQSVDCYQSTKSSGFNNVARLLPDKRLCDVNVMPLGSRKCSLPCPGECVVSEWSSWQPCARREGSAIGTEGSCKGAVRVRTRSLIRDADIGFLMAATTTSDPCPEKNNLHESEECKLNETCFTYSAMWMEWSSCILSENSQCGVGRKLRRSNCVRSDGLPVHRSKCTNNGVEVLSPQTNPCSVPCPVDCLLSDWSEWSACSATCGTTRLQSRARQIIRQSSGPGRECPDQLTQNLPCPATPCYAWQFKGWKECVLSHGNCGTGVQERIVVCTQQDGVEVDSLLCKQHQKKRDGGNGQLYDWFTSEELTRACQISCPGECHQTQWSAWGRCHGDCELGSTGSTLGKRTRSRVGYVEGQLGDDQECLENEIEEHNCLVPQCINYIWKVGPYIGHSRDVWCSQEDDDVTVSYGCREELKPPQRISTPYCRQPCDTIPYSYCTAAGQCECPIPFKAYHSSDGLLTSCVDSSNNKQNDQGTEHLTEIVQLRSFPKSSNSVVADDVTTSVPDVVVKPANQSEAEDDVWAMFNPLEHDGTLKVWAYGAIAGIAILLVLVFAVAYLTYSACRKANSPKNKKYRTRRGQTGTVGVVPSTGLGSSVYGGAGLPPYYPASLASPSARSRAGKPLSRASSARSGFSFRDRYDSDAG